MIIAISGKRYSGKDFLAGQIAKSLPEESEIVPLASMLKQDCAYILDVPLEEFYTPKKEAYRQYMVDLAEKYNSKNGYHWCYLWLTRTAHIDTSVIIIPDVRHREQFDFFRAMNAIMVRVESNSEDRESRGWKPNLIDEDPSEVELDSETGWDVVLNNRNNDFSELIDFTRKVGEAVKRWG